MKTWNLFRLALGLALICSLLPAQAVTAQTTPQQSLDYVPGEVLVAFPAGRSPRDNATNAQALAGQVGADVVASFEGLALLSVDPGVDVTALAEQLTADGQVVFAQPNWIYDIPEAETAAVRESGDVRVPADAAYRVRGADGASRSFSAKQLAAMRTVKSGKSIPSFPKEITTNFYQSWGWDLVETDVIWRNSATSTAVCVIDTGVDANHADLRGRVIKGYDFINDDTQPDDDSGHGTHVAGIIMAKNNNTNGSALGISNGKVVAVKALNAQGRGTSYSIAAAVRYCADRTDVRVINMSLGSGVGDTLEYAALRYAIVDKGKLVVAAAGNGGTSVPDFPAGWADPLVSAPGGGANEISTGLVAVAAARSNPPYVRLWVDTNGNDVQNADEWFEGTDCATRFTNYGRHVQLVAPGDQIYSTQPTSYPFFNNYMYAYAKGYEYDTGTSMAAPYAAGAAVRTLSVFKTLTAAQLKARLIDTGRDLDYTYHQGIAFDLQNAYATPDYDFGIVGEDNVERAPFCWPGSEFGAANSMTGARYLDVSAAMGRVGFYAEVYNASNGLPLNGAKVAITREGSSTILDTGLVGTSTAGTFVQNIPLPSGTKPYDQYYLWVSKSGYTSGYQWFESPYLPNPELDPSANKGGMLATPYNTVAVPPNKNVWVVLNWAMFSQANMDLSVWLPEDSAANGVVSAGRLEQYLGLGTYRGPDWDRGTLLKPAQIGSVTSPYAQLMLDGGDGQNSDTILHFDAVQIKDAAARGTQPFYSPTNTSQPYQAFVTDFSGTPHGGLGGNTPAMNAATNNFAYPMVRVWFAGRMQQNALVSPDVSVDNGCKTAGNDWWHVLDLQGTLVTEISTCAPASSLP